MLFTASVIFSLRSTSNLSVINFNLGEQYVEIPLFINIMLIFGGRILFFKKNYTFFKKI